MMGMSIDPGLVQPAKIQMLQDYLEIFVKPASLLS